MAKLFDPRAAFATAWSLEGPETVRFTYLCKNRFEKCNV